MHGGNAPSGLSSPSLKTGKYSKVIPSHLKDAFERALGDADLLSVREDIALLETRVSELLASLTQGGTGNIWNRLARACERYQNADTDRDRDRAISALLNGIADGIDQHSSWTQLANLFEQRRRLIDSERARLKDMGAMVTAEQAGVMLATVLNAIRRHVHDTATLSAIARDLGSLVDSGARATARPRGEPELLPAG